VILAAPLWLLGLLALPLAAGLELWATSRDRERTARLVSRPLWGRVVRRPRDGWRFARLALLMLGAAGVVLALARPQWGILREKVEREGVDVVIALDTSGSMATEDVAPSRFFLARAALGSLLSRLGGDRMALVAFESEAYPLVPLTLDADAVGLFLETVEPGMVPAPGSSLGVGLAKGLEMFVDQERRNKVLVLVSDGEDLEGEVEEAVGKARAAGVVVHTVGVGTEKGAPVPDFDREGNRAGFKKDGSGTVVVSRPNPATLEAVARGTGGRSFWLTPADTSLSALASAIEGMEQRALAREYSYRRRERFQVPLAAGLLAIGVGLLLPPPPLRRPKLAAAGRAAAAIAAWALLAGTVRAAEPTAPPARAIDEVLLRARRLTEQARKEYERGNHPQALSAFERAAGLRPDDPQARFNLGAGLYKNGKFDEAEAIYRALGQDSRSPLAPAARFNQGNSLFQKQDYRGAIQAYRDALRLASGDPDARRNLELALRALKEQEEEEKRRKERGEGDKEQKGDKEEQGREPRPGNDKQARTRSEARRRDQPRGQDEEQQERFLRETGMPRERAMQLLEALQQGEKSEQRRLLAARRAEKRGSKDW
jgi:Ca-activated chloride channel family protein